MSECARFRLAFHQLSKSTEPVCQTRPSDLMVRELSGENRDTGRPSPTASSQESVRAKAVE